MSYMRTYYQERSVDDDDSAYHHSDSTFSNAPNISWCYPRDCQCPICGRILKNEVWTTMTVHTTTQIPLSVMLISNFDKTATKSCVPRESTPAPTPTYHFHNPGKWDTHSYDCQCPICGQSVDAIMRTTSEQSFRHEQFTNMPSVYTLPKKQNKNIHKICTTHKKQKSMIGLQKMTITTRNLKTHSNGEFTCAVWVHIPV